MAENRPRMSPHPTAVAIPRPPRPGGRAVHHAALFAAAAVLWLASVTGRAETAAAPDADAGAVGDLDGGAAASPTPPPAPPTAPWARSIGTDRREYATSIAVGADGASYLTGFFLGGLDGAPGEPRQPTAGDSDVLLVKLDAAGRTLWARRFGAESADEGRALAIGPGGDVYLTGFFSGTVDFDPGPGRVELTSAGSADVFVARLTSDGELVWARRAGGPAGDTGYDLAVDAAGRVHLAGYFQGEADLDPGEAAATLASAGGLDAFWLRLDGDGGYLGSGRFGGKANDEAQAIAALPDGSSIVCGVFRGTAGWGGGGPWTSRGSSDVFLLRIDAGGEPRKLLQLGGSLADACGDVAPAGDGGIVAIGRFAGDFPLGEGDRPARFTSRGGSDALVVALDPEGGVRWARALGDEGNDFGFGVAVDADGSIWATGFSQPVAGKGGGETRSFVTRLAAGTGEPVASHRLVAEAGIQLLTVALGPGGAPHVAGVYGGDATVRLPGEERRLSGSGKIDVVVARLAREGDL